MSSQRENSTATKHKGIEYYDLTNKDFKIAIMMKFNILQENSKRQFNKPRNKYKLKEQKNFFTTDFEIIKKNQAEILDRRTQ